MTEKIKPAKFTFKKHRRNTGLYAVGNPNQPVDVKFNKKRFGIIHPSSWSQRYWHVMYAVQKTKPDGNPNCDWYWKNGPQFISEQEAREWLQSNAEKITKEPLHFFEDEDEE